MILTNPPMTMRQAYLANLKKFFICETRKHEDIYKASLTTAKFPTTSTAKIRTILKDELGYSEESITCWMKVFATLMNDETISSNPLMPVSNGTVIVPLANIAGIGGTANMPAVVTGVTASYFAVRIPASNNTANVYPANFARYASDKEIDTMVNTMVGGSMLPMIIAGSILPEANKFTDAQPVFTVEDEPEEKEEE